MYKAMVPKLQRALAVVSPLPIRIVINTHFHGDHIQGNSVLGATATIIGHENTLKRLSAGPTPPFPMVTFKDAITVRFNGENIVVRHLPNSHTDGDAVVFFETSKVLHLGDLFFVGMFPAVYREGGGDIRQLIVSLDRVLAEYPAETKVIPGHGDLATMDDLRRYTAMLKETVAAVETGLRQNKTPEDMRKNPAITKYAALGEGGAQTLAQYVDMLVKLLR
jgi:glyoxylase-like metal-dependent hydrolase (beta-lactamase superfamily II)